MANKNIKSFALSDTTIERINKCKKYMNDYRKEIPIQIPTVNNSQVVENAIKHYYDYLRRKKG